MPMPGLGLLLMKKKPSVDDGADEPMDDDGHSKEDTCRAVMKAFVDAVHDKDVESAMQSFKDLVDLCGEGGDDE
jgi:hypothetical protein